MCVPDYPIPVRLTDLAPHKTRKGRIQMASIKYLLKLVTWLKKYIVWLKAFKAWVKQYDSWLKTYNTPTVGGPLKDSIPAPPPRPPIPPDLP